VVSLTIFAITLSKKGRGLDFTR